MNKVFSPRISSIGIALALCLGCCSAALAQGMSEYAGVTAIPKAIPRKNVTNGLGGIYGASSSVLDRVSAAGSKASTGSQRTSQTVRKAGKPAMIMSGDLPGTAIQAQREAVLGVTKVANETYSAGMEAKKKGKLDEAEALLRKSVNARETYWAERDHKIPDILVDLGDINASRGNDKKAVEDLNSALAFYSKFYGPGSDHRLKPLLLMSDCYKRLGEKSQSYDCYKQAYQLATRAKLDAYNPVDLRLNTVKMALEVGKFREAVDMCEIAVNGSDRAKLRQDQLLSVMADYATALKGMNRTRDADEVLAEAEKIKGSSPAAPESTEAKPTETTAK